DGGRVAGAGAARRARQRPRVSQCLPASRHAALPHRIRARARDRLSLSRQGDLLACAGMPEGLDKARLGLKPVRAETAAGLIYLSLAAEPPAFDGLRERFAAAARPQGFDRARVAKI